MGPLLDLGKRKTLDLHDVPFLDDSDSVHGITPKFKSKIASISATGQYTDVTTVKLVKSLVLTTWKLIIITAVYALIRTVTSYVGPYLIEHFVDYLNQSTRSTKRGYLLVLAFVAAQLMEGLSSRHLLFRSQQLGLRVHSALIAIIYQKGLALSSQSKQGSSSGELINVVNIDAERVPTLQDLDLCVQQGTRVAICGTVGSGERGINLSGGQKQRIQIARACIKMLISSYLMIHLVQLMLALDCTCS
ncbi:putative non-intrinsic ABC protein 5, partial [Zea mays]